MGKKSKRYRSTSGSSQSTSSLIAQLEESAAEQAAVLGNMMNGDFSSTLSSVPMLSSSSDTAGQTSDSSPRNTNNIYSYDIPRKGKPPRVSSGSSVALDDDQSCMSSSSTSSNDDNDSKLRHYVTRTNVRRRQLTPSEKKSMEPGLRSLIENSGADDGEATEEILEFVYYLIEIKRSFGYIKRELFDAVTDKRLPSALCQALEPYLFDLITHDPTDPSSVLDVDEHGHALRPSKRRRIYRNTVSKVKWGSAVILSVAGENGVNISAIEKKNGVSVHANVDAGTLRIVGPSDFRVAQALGECHDLAYAGIKRKYSSRKDNSSEEEGTVSSSTQVGTSKPNKLKRKSKTAPIVDVSANVPQFEQHVKEAGLFVVKGEFVKALAEFRQALVLDVPNAAVTSTLISNVSSCITACADTDDSIELDTQACLILQRK